MKSNWKLTNIEDCSTILGDGLHGTPKYDLKGEYAFINGNNLQNGKIKIKPDTKRVNVKEYEKYKKDLNERTILVSINGTLGNVATYNEEKVILGKSACYFNVSEHLDVGFMKYVVSTPKFRQYIHSVATGTTIKNVSLKQMREYSFYIPDYSEQKKISSILSALDDKIEVNQKINENLEQQAKAIYKEMFIDNQSLEFKTGVLGDIANITMGQSPNGKSYNEDGIGEVFYQGRAEFGFRFPTRRLFTTEPERIAEKDDILLSVRAPVGDLNVAYEKCCIGRGLSAIQSKYNHKSFLLYTMFSLKKQLDLFNGEGTVFGSINKDALNSLSVNIPSIDDINKFEDIVSPIDKIIRNNYDEIQRLTKIRDTLLPKLMNGEIDVGGVEL